ncbi:MAG: N-acetylmuramoyl-L-alanine amidase [Holosporaceae bacterium]|jgi:N-acetylmuramoyl-L-alanine amidase|nr:N-acetylmuramoyl-L-alanine amidase [Holosporaceae bacterium]
MFYKTIKTVFFITLLSLLQNIWADEFLLQVVKKISLKREKDRYSLCVDFDEKVSFVPRIHTLPNGAKMLLSFNRKVALPLTKRISHNIIKGYFFEKFSPSSLMFVVALKENVAFVSKKYTKNSIKIEFEIPRKHTIVIDAGHGGKDPGTRGIGGNFEKNITLITAIELRNALLKSNRYKVILTRDRDVFTSIDERKDIINSSKADFLISLHTDSNEDKNLRGISIYTLPNLDHMKNASAEMKNDVSAYYKILSQSRKFSKYLIGYIPNACKVKNRPCRNSELRILKTNIPAVLIELGCISNKIDNELLHSQDFRTKTVYAILYALDNFFEKGKP